MIRAVMSLIGKRRGVSRSVRSLVTASLLAGLLAWTGCGPPPSPGQIPLVGAKQVTIAADYSANPGTLYLSKGNKDTFQWHNTSSVDLLVVFKNDQGNEFFPGQLLIPANQFSAAFRVCQTCPNGTYDYRFYRKVGINWVQAVAEGTPPTVPDIGVGD